MPKLSKTDVDEMMKFAQDVSEESLKRMQEIVAPTPRTLLDFVPEHFMPPTPVNPNLASEFHRRLLEWIHEFDRELDQEHEVGVRLVSFGNAVTFHLEHIGYWDPSLISFSGFAENGDPVELIQHVTQISILLIKMKRQDSSKPKQVIGFA